MFRNLILVSLLASVLCCDLEEFFNGKQVSVEENTATSQVIFRGFSESARETASEDAPNGYIVSFELKNTYKGAYDLERHVVNNYRKINVTLRTNPKVECRAIGSVPAEYIIFCEIVDGEITAIAIANWDENIDQRVWSTLGWTKWTDWSDCSLSCSSGIQQRFRRCRLPACPGFNVEQRRCNSFGCEIAVNALALEENKFYHPSKEKWEQVPDRPSAWRLKPDSYIWVPSTQLFKNNSSRPFPKQFVVFITLRLVNHTMGTIFSLRSRRQQDTYLSLEVAGSDLKLIHAASNGTDVVRIPTPLYDGLWHQIAISIRGSNVVTSFVDCEWSRTDILRNNTLEIPEDVDVIIGYLFSGDLEQLTIVTDPAVVTSQCATLRTPILDPSVEYGKAKNDKDQKTTE